MTSIVVYIAERCSLCERALEVVRGAQAELGFELAVVDIEGVAELEARYRERIPVVEIDGERAFTYFVEASALRERVRIAVLSTKSEAPQAES